MKILVDGKLVVRVRSRDEVSVEVWPGSHEVVAKMDWVSSDPVRITIARDETIVLLTRLRNRARDIDLDLIPPPLVVRLDRSERRMDCY